MSSSCSGLGSGDTASNLQRRCRSFLCRLVAGSPGYSLRWEVLRPRRKPLASPRTALGFPKGSDCCTAVLPSGLSACILPYYRCISMAVELLVNVFFDSASLETSWEGRAPKKLDYIDCQIPSSLCFRLFLSIELLNIERPELN